MTDRSDLPPWSYTCGDGPDGLLELGEADHVITDAPYVAEVDENNAADRVRNPGAFGFAPMTDDLRVRTARAIGAVCRRWSLTFCAYEEAHLWREELEKVGMIYWQLGHFRRIGAKPQMTGKGPAQPNEAIVICHSRLLEQRWNGGGKMAEWSVPVARGDDRMHPTQKPTMLMKMLIEDFTDEGELIADPFAGVATTGVAAVSIGRRFWGRELDPGHYKNGLDRLSMPLFERKIEQSTLFDMPAKGHVARARMELDRLVLQAIASANSHGTIVSEIATALPIDIDPRELERSLKRLLKAGAITRQGKTSSTRYFFRHTLSIETTDNATHAGDQP